MPHEEQGMMNCRTGLTKAERTKENGFVSSPDLVLGDLVLVLWRMVTQVWVQGQGTSWRANFGTELIIAGGSWACIEVMGCN